jgi:hypothetical protein
VKVWSFHHGALRICTAAILAGCGGSQPSGAMPQTSASYKQSSVYARGNKSPTGLTGLMDSPSTQKATSTQIISQAKSPSTRPGKRALVGDH